MSRIGLFALIALCRGTAAVGSDAVADAAANLKIVIQDDRVLLFDTEADVDKHDLDHCFTTFIDVRNLKKLRRLMKRGKPPRLETELLKDYFDPTIFSATTYGQYLYNGRPIQVSCSRRDLIVIKSVNEK